MSKPKLLISDGMAEDAVQTLQASGALEIEFRKKTSLEELLERLPTLEAIAIRSATRLTGELLEKASNLKLIVRLGAGVDNIDVPAAVKRGICVMNTASANALSAAEQSIALMFAVARKIPQAAQSMLANKWDRENFVGFELSGKTLGIAGFGQIGRLVARKALGLDMKVLAYDPFVTSAPEWPQVKLLSNIEDLVAQSDIVTLHLPKVKETANLFGEKLFASFKKGSVLIQVSRGGIVDEKALLGALESGRLKAAALDVFEKEPPDFSNPLLKHPAVIAVPHLGASTLEAQDRVGGIGADKILNFFAKNDRSGEIK